MYHVAPSHIRKSIKAYGIDPSLAPYARSTEGQGFYGFTDLEEAKWYAEYMAHYEPREPFDIWEFDSHILDPDRDPEFETGIYHPDPVESARLIATYDPNWGWRPINRTSNVFDPPHDELDTKVFRGITPKTSIRRFILKTIYDAFEQHFGFDCKPYVHPFLTGSLTTYQYSPHSDCDISLFIDWEKWPAQPQDLKAFRFAMVAFVIDKIDGTFLPGTQHPLQTFVISPGLKPTDMYKPGLRSAYDLQLKTWIVPPEKSRVHNVTVELPAMYLRAAAIARKMEAMLDTNPTAAIELYKRVHRKRQQAQQRGWGDYSEGNIVYKFLDHQGLFNRLRSLGQRIASPWVNEYGEPIGYDQEEDPKEEWGYEGEYYWSDEDVPDEHDGYIYQDRSHWRVNLDYKEVASFSTGYDSDDCDRARMKAIRELAAEMDRQGFYPNCWEQDRDHEARPLNIIKELEEDKPLYPVGTSVVIEYDNEAGIVVNVTRMKDYDWQYRVLNVEEGSYTVAYEDELSVPTNWSNWSPEGEPGDIQIPFELQNTDFLRSQEYENEQWYRQTAFEPIPVLYDFDSDEIILGLNEVTASDDDGNIKIMGLYDGNSVTLFHDSEDWVNANHFKRLWVHSFPDRPIDKIYLSSENGSELVSTKPYRRRRTPTN